jgi:hypothetical protein
LDPRPWLQTAVLWSSSSRQKEIILRGFFFAENEGESGGTALKTRKNRILCIQFWHFVEKEDMEMERLCGAVEVKNLVS